MVLNLTRPTTFATFPAIATQREKVTASGYDKGRAEAESKFVGLSKEDLISTVRKMRREIKESQKRHADLNKKLNTIDRLVAIVEDTALWAKDFLKFERPAGGAAKELRQALKQREVFSAHEIIAGVPLPSFEGVFEDGEIFRVEHDWLKAIKNANEFEAGSFRLPYETCIFEFQVSRKPVVAMCLNYASDVAENEIIMQLAVESFFGWILSHNIYRHNGCGWEVLQGGASIKEDKFSHLVELVGNQIRAACIALDAEVATTTLIREPHEGKRREDKDRPAYEFHTIRIASRPRPEALQVHGTAKGTKRLHFRRGHWRHYATSKTWVRWCLVGNPELGFIDKQYRL